MISDNMLKFYINGAWVEPLGGTRVGAETPATEEMVCEVALGFEADADRAILAARAAFDAWTVVAVANDTPYGLAACVQGALPEARAGQVNINDSDWDTFAPFGGYKQSGNGRQYADWGIHDFCEVKGIVGYGA